MTGPDCRLEYKKILIGRHELEPIQDPTFGEMRQLVSHCARQRDDDRLMPSRYLDEVCISCHSWSSDGEYFGFCTEDAQIVVYKCGTGIAFHMDLSNRMMGSLISMKMHEQGLVAVSDDGHMFFYEIDETGEF